MNPVIGGALISGASSIIGGMLGKEPPDTTGGFSSADAAHNQKVFAKHGIRWRVEDAKAAGLHPLFALGGSGAAFQPPAMAVGGDSNHMGRAIADAGQDIGRAVSAQESPEQRAVRLLTMDQMRASAARDYAQAAYWASQANRQGQANNVATAFPVRDGREPIESMQLDRIQVKPDELTSFRAAEPDITAGRGHAGWRETNMGSFRMLAPVNEEGWSEGLESMPLVMWPQFLKRNMEKYGRQWLADFIGLGRRDPGFNLQADMPRRGPTISGRIKGR